MIRARHLTGAAVVVGVAVAVGCASKANSKAKTSVARAGGTAAVAGSGAPQPVAAPSGSAPVFEPVGPDAPADPADVTTRSLAQHSQHYAQNLETLLSKRQPRADHDGAPAAPGDGMQFRGVGGATDSVGDLTVSTIPSAAGAADEAPARAEANRGMQVPAPASKVVTDPSSAAEAREAQKPVAAAPATRQAPEARLPADAQTAGAKLAVRAPAADSNDLLQKLAARLKDDPRDAASHLNYQLLQFLLEEQVPELSTIAPLPAEDRELLTTLLDGLSNFRNGLRAEANSLQSKKVAPLLELAERLRSQGELAISTAALCSKVDHFGVYEPMEPPRFIAGGKNNQAILYCEVANFSSQLNDKKLWETKLKQEAVLYSETGLAVWSDKSDTVIDQSRVRLHDFFIADKIRLPASLPVGRYLMKMTVTDLHANRVAEATVPIQIVAQ